MKFVVQEDGSFYSRTGDDPFRAETLPSGVSVDEVRRAWAFAYNGAVHVGGPYNKNLVYYMAAGRLRRQGIEAPVNVPTLMTGGGSGLTGSMVGYYCYAELDDDGNILARSSLSPASPALACTDDNITWTLPASASDSRVTHVILFREVDGDGLPKQVGDPHPIGTTAVTEAVETSELQAELFEWGDDGGILDADARGVPPASLFALVFAHMAWYMDGTSRGFRRSRLYEPEAVSDDLINSLELTPDGSLPWGACVRGDEMMVWTVPSGMWSVRVLSTGDISWTHISNADPLIATHGPTAMRGSVCWPGPRGIMAYDGGGSNAIRNLMDRTWQQQWMEDYAANKAAFQDMQGRDNGKGFIQFLIPLPDAPKTLCYRGYYAPMYQRGASEPVWTRRILDRQEYAQATFYDLDDFTGNDVWGDEAGYIREDDPTNRDDDEDTYLKRLTLRTGHIYAPGGLTGDDNHGATFTAYDLFMRNDDCDVDVTAWVGGIAAADGTPKYEHTVEAAAAAAGGFVDRDSVHESFDGGIPGPGVTLQIDVDEPDPEFEFLGFAVDGIPYGQSERGARS